MKRYQENKCEQTLVYIVECSPMVWEIGFNLWSSHTKDSKMVLDAFLLNTQHYKVYTYIYIYRERERERERERKRERCELR